MLRAALLAGLAAALVASGAAALDEERPPVAPEPAATTPAPAPTAPAPIPLPPAPPGGWRPPAHETDPKKAKDWVLFKSGELVRGRIKDIRDEKVDFDSDQFEEIEIDWSDVAAFSSPKLNTYRFGNETIVTGTAEMRGGVIRVDSGTELREFARADLFAMVEGEPRELNYWSFKGSLGLTLRSGTSDELDVSTRMKLQRETALTRALMTYEDAYSEANGSLVTNNRRLAGQFNYYVTTRWYAAAPIAELYVDRVRNVDLRGTVGGGVGYEVIDVPKAEWNVLGGIAYQRTDYGAIEAGQEQRTEDAALVFQTKLELDPFKDVDWDTTYTLLPVVTDWGKTSQHLSSVFSFEVWGPLDLDVTFTWDRIQDPPRDPDGHKPKSDDFQLTVGIAIDL